MKIKTVMAGYGQTVPGPKGSFESERVDLSTTAELTEEEQSPPKALRIGIKLLKKLREEVEQYTGITMTCGKRAKKIG